MGKQFGVHVVSILRGRKRINIPGASVRVFPEDKIQVIGTDEELNQFGTEMEKASALDMNVVEKSETILRQFLGIFFCQYNPNNQRINRIAVTSDEIRK